MSAFLTANRDNPNPRGYRKGDIVVVKPDGWEWSRAELSNVVKLPLLVYSEKQAARWADPDFESVVTPTGIRRIGGGALFGDPIIDVLDPLPDNFKVISKDGSTLIRLDKGASFQWVTRAGFSGDALFAHFEADDGQRIEWVTQDITHAKRRFKIEAGKIVDKVP